MTTAPAVNFSNLAVLVIDDHPGMRTSLRITLSNFGVTKTDMSQGAFDAVHRIKQRAYDVIICDYNLGEGRDGQQLLEELRHGKLISMSTVFLMVTAERGYERVMSAAELAPDDYLIKPFTAESLQQRLTQILRKKAAFAQVHLWLDQGQLPEAVLGCDRICALPPAYTIDAWRLKAELLIALGRLDEAKEIYDQVLAMRVVPWARMGLARTLFLQERHDEAEGLLLDLVDDAPDFMAAQDFLAQVQEAQDKAEAALETLAKAAARSPNILNRQRALGEVALSQGDLDTAERAFSTVVERNVHSILRSGDDHARLARVQVEQGKLQEAGATLRELRSHFPNDPKAAIAADIVESLKETRAGNAENARTVLERALSLAASHEAPLTEQISLDLAKACLSSGLEAEGQRLVQTLVNNNHEDNRLLRSSRRMFQDLGRADEGERLIQESVKVAVSLNNEAVMRARQGKLEEAADMLTQAATNLPNNVQIQLNAAQSLLSLMARDGWSPEHAQKVRDYIRLARERRPDHPKLGKVVALQQQLAKKFGVRDP